MGQTVQTSLFILFTLAALITLVVALVLAARVAYDCGTGRGRGTACARRLARLKRALATFAVLAIVDGGLVAVSQVTASTPAIRDEAGRVLEGSIAELIQVNLNGRKEWIGIRGRDRSAPVLLFLAGGPGGTDMAVVRHELAALEQHFVVVGWDQAGSGKSYGATPTSSITAETYIQDGLALTEYLADRFGHDRIFLLGESWGSALAVFLAARRPERYHALIGTGQMVAFAETERLDYAKAMELARQAGDTATVRRLEANGAPPYYGKRVTMRSAVYLNYLTRQMARNPAIHNAGYKTLRDMLSSEYGLLDKVNFVRGIINTFDCVYQQLYDIDLRHDYARLDVPVYFFEGRHDLNAPTSLVEDYFAVLEAPEKELVWFEHSGHNPWMNETDRFVNELLLRFKVKE
jgi:pimeloyl-ACP methyl ester carboxylesterase